MPLYDYQGDILEVSGNVSEPLENDLPVVGLFGTLPTLKADGEYPIRLFYKSATDEFEDYATAKVQGDSSQRYPKKNFTIKLFSDSGRSKKDKRLFKDWDKKRNKFVLKANWIDHSHARNIVNARLWGNVVKSRSDYTSLPSELRDGNLAIDGFPVKVYNNGIYLGIYTFNLPKDAMYGLDAEIDENCIIQSEGDVDDDSLLFRTSTMNGKWADELHDDMPSIIETKWTAFLAFNNESTDTVFHNNLSNYMDVPSLIDMHIFVQVGCIVDNIGKNQTFFTYDAKKWYTGMYDMDGTWGLAPFQPDVRGWLSPQSVFQNDYNAYRVTGKTNKLHDRLSTLFHNDIISRYSELRNGPLSEDAILTEFEHFMQTIPPYVYEEDYAETTGGGAYTDIPLAETNNIFQIRQFVKDRLLYVDSVMSN